MSQATIRLRESTNGTSKVANDEPPKKRRRRKKSRWETTEDQLAREGQATTTSTTTSTSTVTVANINTTTNSMNSQVLNANMYNNNNTMHKPNVHPSTIVNLNPNASVVPGSQPINYAKTESLTTAAAAVPASLSTLSPVGTVGGGGVSLSNLNNLNNLNNGLNLSGWNSSSTSSSPIANTILKQKLVAMEKLLAMQQRESQVNLPGMNQNGSSLKQNGGQVKKIVDQVCYFILVYLSHCN